MKSWEKILNFDARAVFEDMKFRRLSFSYIVLLTALLLLSPALLCDSALAASWKTLKTKYVILKYVNEKDLDEFEDELKFDVDEWGFRRIMTASGSKKPKDEVSDKLDALYERVQVILDMRKKMKPVTIILFPDRKSLEKAAQKIFKKKVNFRSWYHFEEHTIFVNVKDVHAGMVAHEMAHSIIDHFLLIKPPTATAEILATYVDAHLFKKKRNW